MQSDKKKRQKETRPKIRDAKRFLDLFLFFGKNQDQFQQQSKCHKNMTDRM